MSSFSGRSSEPASRIFLLSPANCGGARARLVLSPAAQFDLARQLNGPDGVELGDLFAFVSGLYFRGKLAYARRFAAPIDPDGGVAGVHVITPNAGLRGPETRVTADAIRVFASADIDPANAAYRQPLEASARALARDSGDCEIVLLGSIASPKYVDVLLGIFGDRLVFPIDFVGRGDMSRGGLMLRHAASGVELPYVPVAGAVRRGTRPPKLAPLPPAAASRSGTTGRGLKGATHADSDPIID